VLKADDLDGPLSLVNLCLREQVDLFPFHAIAAVKLDGKPRRLASKLFAVSGKNPPVAPNRSIRPENQSASRMAGLYKIIGLINYL
jgi:hypothetical protein